LLQKRLLLISVFRLDCFTLLATLFDQLVFGQLWGRLRFDVVRVFFGIGTGMTLVSIDLICRRKCREPNSAAIWALIV
jgi:hypothetical protein